MKIYLNLWFIYFSISLIDFNDKSLKLIYVNVYEGPCFEQYICILRIVYVSMKVCYS